MPKELFNQPLIVSPNEPDDTDRVALGTPSSSGGKNITWARLKLLLGGSIPEAPIDGKTYGRKDADWAEVITGTADIATNADMDAGTNDTKAVSPLKFVYGITTRVFSALTTTSKTIQGAINEIWAKLSPYPEIPAIPSNNYLRDDGTFQPITAGVTDTSANLYASNVNSATVGYKKAAYDIDVAEVIKTISLPTPNVIVWGEKYLYDSAYNDILINSGQWQLHATGYVDLDVSTTHLVLRAFKYSVLGVETELFQKQGPDINIITRGSIFVDYESPSIIVDNTDRIGYQIGAITTSAAARTVSYIVGDGDATHLSAPFSARHSRLRDKNEQPSFQHVDATSEKMSIEAGDKVALYDSVTGNVRVVDPSLVGVTETNELALSTPLLGATNQDAYNVANEADKNAKIETFNPVLLFDHRHKIRKLTMDAHINYSLSPNLQRQVSFIEDILTGDGTNGVTIPNTFINTNGGVFNTTKVNALIFYYDIDGRVRYTIENLESSIGLIQLSIPQNFQAISGGETQINLSWASVDNASNYTLEVSDSGSNETFGELTTTSNLTYQHTGLVSGTTKYYRLRANGDQITYSNSAYTDTENATTSSATVLDTPTLSLSGIDSRTNRATWSNVAGETGYDLQRSPNGVDTWVTIYSAAANILTFDDTNRDPEVQNFYRVKALGNGTTILDSAYSVVQNIITNAVVVPTITVVLAANGESAAITLGNIDVNATLITLERDTDIDFTNPVAVEEYSSQNTSVVDLLLDANTLYYYRARTFVSTFFSDYAIAGTRASIAITAKQNGMNITNNALWPTDASTDKPFTIEVWIKPTRTGIDNYFVRSAANTTARISAYITSTGKMTFEIHASGTVFRRIVTVNNITFNEWQQVILTYNGNMNNTPSMQIIINNVLQSVAVQSTGEFTKLPVLSGNYEIQVPLTLDSVSYYTGNITLFRWFNALLSSTDVTTIYNNKKPLYLSSGALFDFITQENRLAYTVNASIGVNGVAVGVINYSTDLP